MRETTSDLIGAGAALMFFFVLCIGMILHTISTHALAVKMVNDMQHCLVQYPAGARVPLDDTRCGPMQQRLLVDEGRKSMAVSIATGQEAIKSQEDLSDRIWMFAGLFLILGAGLMILGFNLSRPSGKVTATTT